MAYIDGGHGRSLLAINIAMMTLTCVFAAMRIYVRCFMVKLWKVEDWFFLTSQLLFLTFSISSVLAAIHGNGQRLTNIDLADLTLAMKYWYIGELLYIIVVLFIKLSIGFFLLRIVSIKKLYIHIIRAALGITVLVSITYFFFLGFQCKPVDYFWMQFSGHPGSCLRPSVIQNTAIAQSVVSAAVDFIFGILPFFLIWNLQINTKAKVAASVLLSLGIIAGITVLVRIRFVAEVSLSEDFLFATYKVALWGVLEPAVGICCAAASTFRPLFKSLQDRTRSKASKSTGATNNGNFNAGNGQNSSSFPPSKSSRSGNKSAALKSMETEHESDDEIPLDPMSRGEV